MSNKIPNVITLGAFERIIRELMAFQAQQSGFADDMDKYLDGRHVTTFGSNLVDGVVEALESCFAFGDSDNPHGGIISWWLWDAPDAGKDEDSSWIETKEGVRYSLHTIPLLYEYLTTGKTSEIYQEANA